jgi:hypothetical protein
VGKTRLLDELAARLPGVGLGRGDCSELERHLPYVPLASALREALGAPAIADAGLPALAAVFPELAPGPAGSPPSEAAALESLVGLWRSHAPLVLLLDDLHWADPATLAALAYLHRRSAVLPGAVIATVGAEKALTNHQLHRLPTSARIALPPLSPEELAEAGLEHLHAPTQGHPRLLAATLAAGDRAQVLASLADILLARCRAEGPEAYSLLVCASALDQPFDPAVLAQGTGQGADQVLGRLESLREHRVQEAAGLGYRFRHEMVGEVLRQSLSPALRRFLTERAEVARAALGQQRPRSTWGVRRGRPPHLRDRPGPRPHRRGQPGQRVARLQSRRAAGHTGLGYPSWRDVGDDLARPQPGGVDIGDRVLGDPTLFVVE